MKIKIFIFDVPVIGEAEWYEFEERTCRWWTIWNKDKSHSLTVRETMGQTSLQQRVDDFIKNESGSYTAMVLAAPHCITPAPEERIACWQKNHPEEMKSYIGRRKE